MDVTTLTTHIITRTKPTPTPQQDAPKKTTDNPVTQAIDVINNIITWAIHHPIPVAIAITIAAAFYGWSQLRIYMLQRRGINLPPLGDVTSRTLTYLIKEDKNPVLTKPQKLAQQTQWLTGRTLTALTLLTMTALFTIGRGGIALIIGGTIGYQTYKRVRRVFQYRMSVISVMFQVANAEFKYGKGSEMNMRSYIRVTKWQDIYFPDATIITVPSGYQSEDFRNRERFEQNFTGSVTDQHGWTYEWESARGKVTATPTPKLPTSAPHPGPAPHKWHNFPVGLTYGGKEAEWDVSVAPHILLCGPTGTGKNSPLRTRVAVPVSERFPNGWATFGDLQIGDVIFDADGQPTQVTHLFPIIEKPDLYRLTFSDGTWVDADAEHLWFTETRAARESGWSASKRNSAYRPLLSPEVTSRLRQIAEEVLPDAEVTVPQVAELAGVSPSATWLHDVAGSVGPVAEVQIETEFSYAEQTVEQEQTVTVFPAREAWAALAGYKAKVPDWYVNRPACAEFAREAQPGDLVSVRVLAETLGLTPKKVGVLLRDRGFVATQQMDETARVKRLVSFFPAKDAWTSFAESSCAGDVAWLHLRDKCAELAANSTEDERVTAREVGDVLGLTRDAALATLKRLGVEGELSREKVTLEVGAKTITRPFRIVKTYSAVALLNAVADYGDRIPYDQRDKKVLGQVRTTREILDTLYAPGGQLNHSIPVAAPLELPEVDLPIAPYTFGVWLGDGSSWNNEYANIDHEIVDYVHLDGYATTERTRAVDEHEDFRVWTIHGIRKDLNTLGVLKHDKVEGQTKMIPAVYLRASIIQRRALLAGLLDTDGTVSPSGAVEFDNTNKAIAEGVLELARTLGYRPSIREGRATMNGVDYGPRWTVSWTTDVSPFWLTRKTEAHRERNTAYNVQRNQRRYIVSVEKIAPEPARCIAVDSPRRLYLAGEGMVPSHNSVQQRNILMHALTHPQWRIVGLDPKKVELASLRDPSSPTGLKPQVLKVTTTLEDMTEALVQAEEEMNRRYLEMEAIGVNHFTMLPTPLPALLVMIDETFALLSPENIKSDEGKERDALHARCASLIGSIARLGRAAGVHLCLATQRPDAKILSGELKNNLDARIACGRMDTTPSMMVLDSDAATRLPIIKGRGVLRLGGEFMEYQGYFCAPERFDGFVSAGREMYAQLDAEGGEPSAPVEAEGKKKKKGKKDKDKGSGGGYGFLPSGDSLFGKPAGGKGGGLPSGGGLFDDGPVGFSEGSPDAMFGGPAGGLWDDDGVVDERAGGDLEPGHFVDFMDGDGGGPVDVSARRRPPARRVTGDPAGPPVRRSEPPLGGGVPPVAPPPRGRSDGAPRRAERPAGPPAAPVGGLPSGGGMWDDDDDGWGPVVKSSPVGSVSNHGQDGVLGIDPSAWSECNSCGGKINPVTFECRCSM